jgi:phospholipase/carboxylesterase
MDALCTALIDTLTLFEKVQRKFHPAMMRKHGEILARKAAGLQRAADDFLSGAPAPEDGTQAGVLLKASILLEEAVSRFNESDELEAGIFNAMQAGRKICRACEILFSLRYEIGMIECFFSENIPGDNRQREDRTNFPKEKDRIVHMGTGEEMYARGNASFYVPESSGSLQSMPLVIALHGGYGHGRDFLWTWIREAKSRRFLLLAPTSVGRTWSIADPETDLAPLAELTQKIAEDYPADREKILLTGISDGATFALGCAMRPDSPFSAFNPVCGVLPPGDISCARSRRILWIHGAYDWMFPLVRARQGYASLLQAGADVELGIIPDLAHAWPREENSAILSWFDPGLAFKEA